MSGKYISSTDVFVSFHILSMILIIREAILLWFSHYYSPADRLTMHGMLSPSAHLHCAAHRMNSAKHLYRHERDPWVAEACPELVEGNAPQRDIILDFEKAIAILLWLSHYRLTKSKK